MNSDYKPYQPNFPYKFKKGENVICILSSGRSTDLTVGKTYKVIEQVIEYKSDNVKLIGDTGEIITVFCCRFTTLKIQRIEKLNKLKKIL